MSLYTYPVYLETDAGERCLQVEIDISGPEPENNWPGDAELECVLEFGEDITDTLTPEEIEICRNQAITRHDEDRFEDYRY